MLQRLSIQHFFICTTSRLKIKTEVTLSRRAVWEKQWRRPYSQNLSFGAHMIRRFCSILLPKSENVYLYCLFLPCEKRRSQREAYISNSTRPVFCCTCSLSCNRDMGACRREMRMYPEIIKFDF